MVNALAMLLSQEEMRRSVQGAGPEPAPQYGRDERSGPARRTAPRTMVASGLRRAADRLDPARAPRRGSGARARP